MNWKFADYCFVYNFETRFNFPLFLHVLFEVDDSYSHKYFKSLFVQLYFILILIFCLLTTIWTANFQIVKDTHA